MSPKIKAHFQKRTKHHISLVQKYCGLIAKKFPQMKGLVERGKVHDASKYGKDELDPYIWLTWRYKCQDDGTDPKLPKGMATEIKKATEHHILNNAHHPEFHQSKKTGLLAKGDRDGVPSGTTDASKMTDLDIAEMVADWCAMSEERGNTPKSWADKVVNKRWKFTTPQTKLIYTLIDNVWSKTMTKTASEIANSVLEKRAIAQAAPAGGTAKGIADAVLQKCAEGGERPGLFEDYGERPGDLAVPIGAMLAGPLGAGIGGGLSDAPAGSGWGALGGSLAGALGGGAMGAIASPKNPIPRVALGTLGGLAGAVGGHRLMTRPKARPDDGDEEEEKKTASHTADAVLSKLGLVEKAAAATESPRSSEGLHPCKGCDSKKCVQGK